MELNYIEVVFDQNGVSTPSQIGTIDNFRQGSKNIDVLKVRFENHNDPELIAVLSGQRPDGETTPLGLILSPKFDNQGNAILEEGKVWYYYTIGQQETIGEKGTSWFTAIAGIVNINIRLVKGNKTYVNGVSKFNVEETTGFVDNKDNGWDILTEILQALSNRATYDYVNNAVNELDLKIDGVEETLDLKINNHILETTSAHNIPGQIDSKISTHDSDQESHTDMRSSISSLQTNDGKQTSKIAKLDKDIKDITKVDGIINERIDNVKTADGYKVNEIVFSGIDNKIEGISYDGETDDILLNIGSGKVVNIQPAISYAIGKLIGTAHDSLDTLQEISELLRGDDPETVGGLIKTISEKLNKDFAGYPAETSVDGTDLIIINKDNKDIYKVSINDLLGEYLKTADLAGELPNNLTYFEISGGDVAEPVQTVYGADFVKQNGDYIPASDLEVDYADRALNVYIGDDPITEEAIFAPVSLANVSNATNANKLNNKTEAQLEVLSATKLKVGELYKDMSEFEVARADVSDYLWDGTLDNEGNKVYKPAGDLYVGSSRRASQDIYGNTIDVYYLKKSDYQSDLNSRKTNYFSTGSGGKSQTFTNDDIMSSNKIDNTNWRLVELDISFMTWALESLNLFEVGYLYGLDFSINIIGEDVIEYINRINILILENVSGVRKARVFSNQSLSPIVSNLIGFSNASLIREYSIVGLTFTDLPNEKTQIDIKMLINIEDDFDTYLNYDKDIEYELKLHTEIHYKEQVFEEED